MAFFFLRHLGGPFFLVKFLQKKIHRKRLLILTTSTASHFGAGVVRGWRRSTKAWPTCFAEKWPTGISFPKVTSLGWFKNPSGGGLLGGNFSQHDLLSGVGYGWNQVPPCRNEHSVNNGRKLYTYQLAGRISAINSMNSMAMTACPQPRSKRNFAMAVQKRPVNMFRLEPPAPPETVRKICSACLWMATYKA